MKKIFTYWIFLSLKFLFHRIIIGDGKKIIMYFEFYILPFGRGRLLCLWVELSLLKRTLQRKIQQPVIFFWRICKFTSESNGGGKNIVFFILPLASCQLLNSTSAFCSSCFGPQLRLLFSKRKIRCWFIYSFLLYFFRRRHFIFAGYNFFLPLCLKASSCSKDRNLLL